jgi:hypothetical protein
VAVFYSNVVIKMASSIDPRALFIVGSIVAVGFLVYEIFKGQSTSSSQTSNPNVNPSQTTSSQINPNTANTTPIVITPSVAAPSGSSSQSASGSGYTYYAINYAPYSNYAPVSTVTSTTTTTANRTNYSNTSSQTTNVPVTLNTYQATGFGSSVYGAGANTNTSQPLSKLQIG